MSKNEYIQLPLDFEVWKSIPGYEGLYEVSDQGRVKSLRGRNSRASGAIRKAYVNRYGYVELTLHNRGSKFFLVHALVMLAFTGPRPEGFQINHINGNKADNRPANLEYVTPSENTRHAHRIGLAKAPDPAHLGEANGRAKLTDGDVRTIRSLYENGATQVGLGKQFGVSRIAIGYIVRGEHWKHVK